MPRTVIHAKLESRTSRGRLKSGRQAHWQQLKPGLHLGYQIWPREAEGRWVLRRYLGGGDKYQRVTVGVADDARPADGSEVLSYDQVKEKVQAGTHGKVHRLTVRQAMTRYGEHKATQGQSVSDLQSRGRAHILPTLGELVVAELTAEHLRRWLANLAAAPAQTRPKNGKPQYQTHPQTAEDKRRRQASANRVLSMLKAMLNHAYDEGHVSARDAWGRKLKPFRDVEMARVRYLTVAEAQRLLNGCDMEFRPLVRAALETGARYGELTRLEICDFNADAGTVAVRKSKTGKARHIVLTDEGAAFFRQHCAGRPGHELMFLHSDGAPWKASEQGRLMDAANDHAKITPPITFHGLRHTWASLAVMNAVPLMVVAKNLGHVSTGMVEKHYAHLAPSHVRDAIRAGAPKFNTKEDKKVVALR